MQTTFNATAALICLSASHAVSPAMAQDIDPASVAIVDASDNVTKHLSELQKVGVRVIGRYVSRCRQFYQNGKPMEKRLIDNPGETQAILDAGFALATIYQYNSREEKFEGAPKYRLPVRTPDGKHNWNQCRDAERPNTMEQEGNIDGEAAAEQAFALGQPQKSVIYVGVDYDADVTKPGSKIGANIVDYFKAFKKHTDARNYRLGAYGNGAVLDLLRKPENQLIDVAWLNASPGHAGSADVYNRNRWDLLQTRTDAHWELKSGQIEVDSDIQNPDSPIARLGFWAKGSNGTNVIYDGITAERTKAVHSAIQFVCDSRAQPFKLDTRQPTHAICGYSDGPQQLTFGSAVRILQKDPTGKFVQINCSGNGGDQGWLPVEYLFPVRPDYDVFRDNNKVGKKTECVRTVAVTPKK